MIHHQQLLFSTRVAARDGTVHFIVSVYLCCCWGKGYGMHITEEAQLLGMARGFELPSLAWCLHAAVHRRHMHTNALQQSCCLLWKK